jgi:alanine racemase
VARLPEALALHESGIRQPLVLLAGVLTPDELAEAIDHGFQIVVHCEEQIELLENVSAGSAVVWLKFDTGMNRLGFFPADANRAIERLRSCAAVAELRLMSHLASADELENPVTEEQFQLFRNIVENYEGAVSIANTPGTLGWPQIEDVHKLLGFRGDHWIRPGLALYGVSPFAGRVGKDLGLVPVMRFEARLIATKPLPEGARVGYGGRYRAQSDTTLGIIAAGYGDGYTRHFRTGTPVLLNGRIVSLIGNVSMDMIAVDLGPESQDAIGDIAILWGDGLPVEEVAGWADAIPYELVCGVMHRENSRIVE